MGLSLAVAYGVASVIYATTPAKGRDELSDHGGSLILFGFWMLVATVVAMSAFSAVRVARRHRARMGVSRDLALVTAVPMLLQAGLSVPAYAKGSYGSSVLVAGVRIAVLGLAIAIVATRSTATAPLVVMCGVGAAALLLCTSGAVLLSPLLAGFAAILVSAGAARTLGRPERTGRVDDGWPDRPHPLMTSSPSPSGTSNVARKLSRSSGRTGKAFGSTLRRARSTTRRCSSPRGTRK